MRHGSWVFLGFVLIESCSSLRVPSPTELLTSEDLSLAANQKEPAAQSAIGQVPHWESFNEWQCFEVSKAETGCYDDKTGRRSEEIAADERAGRGYYPFLEVMRDGELHAFEWDSTNFVNCEGQLRDWRRAVAGQRYFCTFAAQIPSVKNDGIQNWAIYGVRSGPNRTMAPIYEPDSEEP